MNRWQYQVREFMRGMGQPTSPAEPLLRDAELRARLILEEAVETAVALVGGERASLILEEYRRKVSWDQPDIVEAVDGLCDLVYVTVGAAEAMGIDLSPHFEAVHTANMQKTIAVIDEHGKQGGKPPGWEAPQKEIRRILEEQRTHAKAGRDARRSDA